MENTFVYLVGPPGVGKYTVGRLLAERMPARLVDNHYWNNPIFEIIEPDGRTPLPPVAWDLTQAVRAAVLEAIASLAPPRRSFVFTHAISDDGGHPLDFIMAAQILDAAERRSARTLLVRLCCASQELARRISAPERSIRLKEQDRSRAETYARLAPFDLKHGWILDLDTTQLMPTQTADLVMEALLQPTPWSVAT